MKKIYSNATIEFLAIEANNILLTSSEADYSDNNNDVQKINFTDWT